jgi:uncharacterized spore protein YtfJ
MDVSELLDKARGGLSAKRVFGTPVHQGDAIVIPVAKVAGGAGGGEGQAPSEQGSGAGSGFGLSVRPVGVFVLRGGRIRWRPAIDVNRVILGGQFVAAIGLLVLGMVLKAQRRLLVSSRQRRGRRRLFLRMRHV